VVLGVAVWVTPYAAQAGEKLVIFHAGSLAIPFLEMEKAFNQRFPEVTVIREASGSRTCARKITDLGRPCDVMASADYTVIETLLFPDHAVWQASFAANEMAIMYRRNSRHADTIHSNNWHRVLSQEDVEYGHSDPNSDPCGYRTLQVWQLAEQHYGVPGLYETLVQGCPLRNIRPKETDLIALLEAGQIDYLFIYRSVCMQHQAPFISLPNEINLGSSKHADFYASARVKVSGKAPGSFIEQVGCPMVYGVTIPKNAANPKRAAEFLALVLGPEGRQIMEKNGQPPLPEPVLSGDPQQLPAALKPFFQ